MPSALASGPIFLQARVLLHAERGPHRDAKGGASHGNGREKARGGRVSIKFDVALTCVSEQAKHRPSLSLPPLFPPLAIKKSGVASQGRPAPSLRQTPSRSTRSGLIERAQRGGEAAGGQSKRTREAGKDSKNDPSIVAFDDGSKRGSEKKGTEKKQAKGKNHRRTPQASWTLPVRRPSRASSSQLSSRSEEKEGEKSAARGGGEKSKKRIRREKGGRCRRLLGGCFADQREKESLSLLGYEKGPFPPLSLAHADQPASTTRASERKEGKKGSASASEERNFRVVPPLFFPSQRQKRKEKKAGCKPRGAARAPRWKFFLLFFPRLFFFSLSLSHSHSFIISFSLRPSSSSSSASSSSRRERRETQKGTSTRLRFPGSAEPRGERERKRATPRKSSPSIFLLSLLLLLLLGLPFFSSCVALVDS